MIALIKNDSYFIDGSDNIDDFLIAYAEYIGLTDMKAFKILVNSKEMSTKELTEYINNRSSWDDEIVEIYEIGKKFY